MYNKKKKIKHKTLKIFFLLIGTIVTAVFLEAGILYLVNSQNVYKTSKVLLDQTIEIVEKNKQSEVRTVVADIPVYKGIALYVADKETGRIYGATDVSKIGVNKLAIENPVGIMSSRWRKPDQIIEPWQFGHEASKKTCLWLKNLPLLTPTNIVGKGEIYVSKSGNKFPKWFTDIFFSGVSPEERRKLRSKTFPGIADAMADQWGGRIIAA